jgi:hypothetical protein
MLLSSRLVASTPIPPLALFEQDLVDDGLSDVATAVREAFAASKLKDRIIPGMRVAMAVGSRGVANLPLLVRMCVDYFKSLGAEPFIVPAMGSHGLASAEGQTALLASLGVTDTGMGCPIQSCMDVVKLGELPNGLPVYMDSKAYAADGIFVLNRVKPHPSFHGPHESGLLKMITIGLGKQIGADSCHTYGFSLMHENLPAMAALSLQKTNILGGMGVVENALEKTCMVKVAMREELFACDEDLLNIAKSKFLRLPFTTLDVLVVDEIGKNISGSGMDSNVVGRFSSDHMRSEIHFTKIVALDLTPESHGNAAGMGHANFITHRLRDKTDFEAMYANCLTATETRAVCMPPALATDRDAIKAAVKTCFQPNADKVRMAHIKNTMEMQRFEASACLMKEAVAKGCRLIRSAAPMRFDGDGTLQPEAWARPMH